MKPAKQPENLTGAERVRGYRQRQAAKGLMAVTVYVPPEHRNKVRRFAQLLKDEDQDNNKQ